MINHDEAKSQSQNLHDEADKLLFETGLSDLLGRYGVVHLGGSYEYDLLVDRDLDFGVAVKEMTPELRSEIVGTFAVQKWAYSVNLTDRINFEPLSSLGAPRGLYLGLTIPFPRERWNVDVWFTLGYEIPSDEIASKVSRATKEQRQIILSIKYELMKSDKKTKGVTSTQIYEAVLDSGVRSTSEFLESIVS